jgi:hypothetical protein
VQTQIIGFYGRRRCEYLNEFVFSFQDYVPDSQELR